MLYTAVPKTPIHVSRKINEIKGMELNTNSFFLRKLSITRFKCFTFNVIMEKMLILRFSKTFVLHI